MTTLHDAMAKVPEEFAVQTLIHVLHEAYTFYDHEGLREDFSVDVSGMLLHFGTKNRLGWSPSIGFCMDMNRCSPEFLFHNRQKAAIRGAYE